VRKPFLAWFLIVGSLTGCSSTNSDQPSKPRDSTASATAQQPSSTEPAKANTIEDVWAQIGCTRSQHIQPSNSPGGTRDGWCSAHGDKLTFFYEFPSAEQATQWLKTGQLSIGPTDAVFTDGAVVILATDAATANDLAARYTPYTR
jgi:hypothetical protein